MRDRFIHILMFHFKLVSLSEGVGGVASSVGAPLIAYDCMRELNRKKEEQSQNRTKKR